MRTGWWRVAATRFEQGSEGAGTWGGYVGSKKAGMGMVRGKRQRTPDRTNGGRLRGDDHGMVTTEIAVALPAMLGIAMVVLWIIALGAGQAAVSQAAREGARAAARGDSVSEVRSAAQEVAPGATVSVSRRGDLIAITASVERRPPLRLLRGLGRTLTATSVAREEEP